MLFNAPIYAHGVVQSQISSGKNLLLNRLSMAVPMQISDWPAATDEWFGCAQMDLKY